MGFVSLIIEALLGHFYLVSFVAGLLGEEAVLFLTFLQSISGIRLEVVLLLSPIGLFVIDIIYYSIGQIGLLKRAGGEIRKIEEQNGILPRIIRFSNRQPLFAMILTKFIYGTRSGLIIYLSTQGIGLKRFLLYNFIAIELWAFLTIPLAWLMGRWWGMAGLDILENFFLIVALALGFTIAIDTIIRIAYFYIKRRRVINLK